jgi:D-amino-acid dehydrogenase
LHSALALIPGGVANGRLFAQQLRTQAQRLGAEFRFHTQVSELQVHGSGIELRHEYTPPEPALAREPQGFGDTQPAPPGPQVERFDAVVVCTGLDVMHLLPTQRLRLAALHELSVTAPLRVLEAHPELGPKAGVIDPSRGMTIAHVGQRVRVSGSRSVTAAAAKAPAADYESLHRGLQHWFPGSVTHQQVQHWQGRRALAVDGLPVVGASGVPGVWLHLPGDDLGWAGVCGGAQVLAQAVGGHKPLLDVTALDARRLT